MSTNKPKRSNIWLHFGNIDKDRAQCNYCLTFLSFKSGSLGNLNRHIKKKHANIECSIDKQDGKGTEGKKKRKKVTYQSVECNNSAAVNVLECILRAGSGDSSHPRFAQIQTPIIESSIIQTPIIETSIAGNSRKPTSARKIEKLDNQVMAFVAKGHHAFQIVDEPEFRKLIQMVSSSRGYQLPSKKTLAKTLLPKAHHWVLEEVKQSIKQAHSICLSLDTWTAANYCYVSVTAHFIDESTKLCSNILECIQSGDKPTGDSLYVSLSQIMEDWQITNKINCIVSDDSANLLAAVSLGDWSSISCFAQSFNLCMQAGLKKISGVTSKVKAIVEYFKENSSSLAKLNEIQDQLGRQDIKLKAECKTRWNSYYVMLDRVLNMKDAIISTLELMNDELLMESRDWDILENVVPILQPFYEITNDIIGENNVTLSKVLIISQLMTRHIVKYSTVAYEHEEITDFLSTLKSEIQSRFCDLEQNEFYADCALLDPRFKSKGFKTSAAYSQAANNLKRRVSEIELNTKVVGPITVHVKTQQDVEVKTGSIWNDFDIEMSEIAVPENSGAMAALEVDKYLNEEYLNRKEDPLEWWRSRKQIYPCLYEYVLKRLCIQANSVSCNRLFSRAGHVLTERRAMLKPDTVSQMMFLFSNI